MIHVYVHTIMSIWVTNYIPKVKGACLRHRWIASHITNNATRYDRAWSHMCTYDHVDIKSRIDPWLREVHHSFLDFQIIIWWSGRWINSFPYYFQRKQSSVTFLAGKSITIASFFWEARSYLRFSASGIGFVWARKDLAVFKRHRWPSLNDMLHASIHYKQICTYNNENMSHKLYSWDDMSHDICIHRTILIWITNQFMTHNCIHTTMRKWVTNYMHRITWVTEYIYIGQYWYESRIYTSHVKVYVRQWEYESRTICIE